MLQCFDVVLQQPVKERLLFGPVFFILCQWLLPEESEATFRWQQITDKQISKRVHGKHGLPTSLLAGHIEQPAQRAQPVQRSLLH